MKKPFASANFKTTALLIIILIAVQYKSTSQSNFGPNDTLIRSAVIFEGDTIEAKVLPGIYVYSYNPGARAKWTRLRNAVYVTYPYARKAAIIFNDINKHISGITDEAVIKKYINSREKELKKHFGDRENIHFLDFQNQMQMPAVYSMADIFVLPSRGPGETWGLSVNEAMANGRAVVVSDKCGCAVDLVEEGVNGYVFQVNNLDGLKSKLKLICANRNELGKMQERSKDKIKKYSLDNLAEAVESTIISVCK